MRHRTVKPKEYEWRAVDPRPSQGEDHSSIALEWWPEGSTLSDSLGCPILRRVACRQCRHCINLHWRLQVLFVARHPVARIDDRHNSQHRALSEHKVPHAAHPDHWMEYWASKPNKRVRNAADPHPLQSGDHITPAWRWSGGQRAARYPTLSDTPSYDESACH